MSQAGQIARGTAQYSAQWAARTRLPHCPTIVPLNLVSLVFWRTRRILAVAAKFLSPNALADIRVIVRSAPDGLKIPWTKSPCGFDSLLRHHQVDPLHIFTATAPPNSPVRVEARGAIRGKTHERGQGGPVGQPPPP
jgi:hypothetical protein